MIYLLGPDSYGPIKIGVSQSPKDRALALQIGCPVPLHLFATALFTQVPPRNRYKLERVYLEAERVLHTTFDKYRLHGEWFNMSVLDILGVVSDEAYDKDFSVPVDTDVLLGLSVKDWRAGRAQPFRFNTDKLNWKLEDLA